MSGKVVGWAFEVGRTDELSPTQRYVLVAYADNASEKEGKCWPDKLEIVEKTGLSRATVYRAIRALKAAGYLSETTDSKGRECIFLRVPWASHGETGKSQGETEASHRETDESQSENGTNKGTVKEPSGTVTQGGQPRKRVEVDRKPVTDREYLLATAIVDAFNLEAGTRVTVDAHLTPIVGRIREKPELSADDHREIIGAIFAGDRWWKGAPGPAIIYGNAEQFERAIETWRARSTASEAPPLRRVPDGPGPPADPARARAARAGVEGAWHGALRQLAERLPPSTYGLWIEPLAVVGAEDDVVYLDGADEVRTWADRRYRVLLGEALSAELGREVQVSFAPLPPDAEAA